MKKARLVLLFVLIMTFTLLTVGCKKEKEISTLSIKDYVEGSVIEMAIGDFN